MQYGLIAVLNNRQIEERRAQAARPAVGENDAIVSRLSAHISKCWESARSAKTLIASDMLDDLRRRNGEYDPHKLAAIRKHGGSEIYMQLTNHKCRGTESWITDMLFQPGSRPFRVKSTPVPEMPEALKQQMAMFIAMEAQRAIEMGIYVTPAQVHERAGKVASTLKARLKEEAKIKADRIEDEIDDVLIQGAWYSAMETFVRNLVTFPAAILKGPVIQKTSKLKWVRDEQTGAWAPQAQDELTPCFYAPSPFDIYPAPDSRGPSDGFVIERISVRRRDLFRMIGVPGYSEEAIRAALQEYPRGYSLQIDVEQQRRELEDAGNWELSPDKAIDVLEFHGSVSGAMLIEWGMDPERVTDPEAEYEIRAMQVGRHTVRCVLNEDPMRRRPYEVASFDPTPGSWWGRGLPRILRDVQDMCNATARALVNNLGLSSGPMVEVEVDRLSEGEDMTSLYPWRIFQTKASKTTPAPAVRFHNIQNNSEQLMRVYEFFSRLADQYAGIQAFDTGVNPTRGAAGTASGLSMLMSASNRQIKRVMSAIDNVIEGSVNRVHTHVMLYGADDDVKGDVDIEAVGVASLVAKEQQQLRKVEFLASTANPLDSQIIGIEGRAELLRDVVQTFDLNPDRIIPTNDELKAKLMQVAAMANAGPPPAPDRQGDATATEDAAGRPAGGVDAALF